MPANGYMHDYNGQRHGHVNGGENYYDRRMREKAEKRERQTQEALDAQREHRQLAAQRRSNDWDGWFHHRFFAELDPILEAVGQVKAEIEEKIEALENRIKE